MEPMIFENQDIVTIRAKQPGDEFAENDVILYRQKGKLTLHRIVQCVSDDEYVLLGDNCSRKEYGIKSSDILGVLVSFKHDGLHYDVSDDRYLSYVIQLRQTERKRTRRKLIYDIILQHINFLPSPIYSKVKSFLKRTLIYKIKLPR